VRRKFQQVLIPQFIVVYSSEKITKIGQYLPELSQKINVSFFMAHSVHDQWYTNVTDGQTNGLTTIIA